MSERVEFGAQEGPWDPPVRDVDSRTENSSVPGRLCPPVPVGVPGPEAWADD